MVRLWILGNVAIDDIVMADGSTAFGQCGGNALYAARGARVWEDAVGVAARIGSDLPTEHRAQLASLPLELALVEVDAPSIHHWALYESVDVRTFVLWKGSGSHIDQSLRADELPPMDGAVACHVAPMPVSVQVELARSARQRVRVLSLDPHDEYIAGNEQALLDLLPELTIFLPSRREAELLFGRDDPEAAAAAFTEAGAAVVAVKLGSEGSVVGVGDGPVVHVPKIDVRVVDPTGAGDAFCGGFTAAYAQGHDALTAACHATVSASVICETRGVTDSEARDRARAHERLDELMRRVGAVRG